LIFFGYLSSREAFRVVMKIRLHVIIS
jgi:hypothetical protein